MVGDTVRGGAAGDRLEEGNQWVLGSRGRRIELVRFTWLWGRGGITVTYVPKDENSRRDAVEMEVMRLYVLSPETPQAYAMRDTAERAALTRLSPASGMALRLPDSVEYSSGRDVGPVTPVVPVTPPIDREEQYFVGLLGDPANVPVIGALSAGDRVIPTFVGRQHIVVASSMELTGIFIGSGGSGINQLTTFTRRTVGTNMYVYVSTLAATGSIVSGLRIHVTTS